MPAWVKAVFLGTGLFWGTGLLVAGVLGVGLIAATTSGNVHAQSRAKLSDVNERLVRVERVLDQSLLDMLQQIEALRREIRLLRGEMEGQANEIANLRKRNRDLYADTDSRIRSLEDQVTTLLEASNPEGGSSGQSSDGAYDQPASGDDKTAVYIPSDETNNVRLDVARLPSGVVPQKKSDDPAEKSRYTQAYDLVNDGQYRLAVESFTAFLDEYPNGAYADNAWYWQGEALYAQRNFNEAIENFTVVAEFFPNSRKTPDAQLKIAFALYEQSRFTASKNWLTEVSSNYPDTAAALLARKRLGEMKDNGL